MKQKIKCNFQDEGFIYLINKNDVRKIELNETLRNKTLDAISQIKQIVDFGLLPDYNVSINKCFECEYKNFCNDIF